MVNRIDAATLAKDKARADALLASLLPKTATVKFGKNYVI